MDGTSAPWPCKCVGFMATVSVVVGPVAVLLPQMDEPGIVCSCTFCGRRYVLLSQTAERSALVVERWLQEEFAEDGPAAAVVGRVA